MRRRDFILLATGALAPLPHPVLGEQAGKVWRMGFLAQGEESFYDALFEALRPLGYVEGKNLVVERRYAEGLSERFKPMSMH
jgi:putative ABC transport system substrate-binding protein